MTPTLRYSGGGPSWLQSARLVTAVAELVSCRYAQPMKATILALVFVALTLIASAQDTPAKPLLELPPGEHYFRSEGRPAFVLGRNPAGMNPKEYADHFRHAAAAG